MTTAWILALLGAALAYVNGANDVSKGIATLVGSGVADERRAIAWGTVCTALGAVCGATFASAMVSTFGGGMLVAGTAQTLPAAIATLVGAASWVLLATRTGLPVSTTHAIVGAIVGVGAAAYGIDGVRWSALGTKVFLPLLLTPLVSLSLVVGLLKFTRGRAVLSETNRTLNALHWLTAGATSFARGANDGPKIVGLMLAASALQRGHAFARSTLFAVVTLGMVAGSVIAGRRVTNVLSRNVTPMDHREGFLTNLVTAVLVILGARYGLPMSTTHVSAGGIIGVGLQRDSLDRVTLRSIALAWVVTLPAAAGLGLIAYGLIRALS
ncbi:MAG: inorganic phosphate transporter [Deltaproteobacteria bacterium]|nr:inorganic phosphate transporter [Deltaproteobacteria bacterium]